MWNRGEIDYEAEREEQEFQAKSGVAQVVAPFSSFGEVFESGITSQAKMS
jgi:hypothetical protein